MAPRYALAKRQAADLLRRAHINKAPVPVEKLAALLGAQIVFESYDGEISGVVRRNRDGSAVIGINSSDPPQRQRFTIAHEIGHLLLHSHEQLHVDKNFPIGLRSGVSGKAIDEKEIESNQFAAALLMPVDFISGDIRPLVGTDVLKAVRRLAGKYGVSQEAMSIRLSTLGYIVLGT